MDDGGPIVTNRSTAADEPSEPRRPWLIGATAFSFAAASVPLAAFQATGAHVMSKGLAEFAWACTWLFVALPYCLVRARQGRATLSRVGLRDTFLMVGALGLVLVLVLEGFGGALYIGGPFACILGHGLLWRLVRGRSPAVVRRAAFVAGCLGATLIVASRHWAFVQLHGHLN